MLRFLIGLAIVASGGLVWACKCVPPPEPAEALKASSAVFVGKVTDVKEKEGERHKTVTMVATKGWKGIKGRDVVVSTSASSASCGFGFAKDMEYLVYARADDKGNYTVTLCSRSKSLAAAGEDIKELGKPEWEGK